MLEKFEHLLVLDNFGNPVSSSTNKQTWLEYRNKGVTATDINKIISPTLKLSSQKNKLLQNKKTLIELNNGEANINSFMNHGNDREPIIVGWAASNFGAIGNDFLFHGSNLQHLATPDGLGEDFVVEIKTSLKPLKSIKQGYMNQIQWQMHVMGVQKSLFIVEQHENFNPISIDYEWVEIDLERIQIIKKHVDSFLLELNNELPF